MEILGAARTLRFASSPLTDPAVARLGHLSAFWGEGWDTLRRHRNAPIHSPLPRREGRGEVRGRAAKSAERPARRAFVLIAAVVTGFVGPAGRQAGGSGGGDWPTVYLAKVR